ncbi:hypothetical protein GCM10027174_10960 [Salinifilum aidingensis]
MANRRRAGRFRRLRVVSSPDHRVRSSPTRAGGRTAPPSPVPVTGNRRGRPRPARLPADHHPVGSSPADHRLVDSSPAGSSAPTRGRTAQAGRLQQVPQAQEVPQAREQQERVPVARAPRGATPAW